MKCFECYSYAYHGDSGFPTMGKNMAIGLNVDRIGAVILHNFPVHAYHVENINL